MRSVRGAVLGALTTAALLALPASAMAVSEPGGAAAPYSAPAGGTQYGTPVTARPVLAELRVPSTMIAGKPPRVTTEVTERGVGTVYMRAAIVDLSTRRTLVTVNMGWVHTGRHLTVPWSASTRVAAGIYQVKISAHDHHGANLLHERHQLGRGHPDRQGPRQARPLRPPKPNRHQANPGYPTPAQTVADGAVFPVQGPHNFGGPENRFGAPREGHIHEGQDILTAEGTPDLVPLAGTIESTSYQAGGAGYYVVEQTTYGLDFMFAHCEANSFTVHEGEAVTAGQQICLRGSDGRCDDTASALRDLGRRPLAAGRTSDRSAALPGSLGTWLRPLPAGSIGARPSAAGSAR